MLNYNIHIESVVEKYEECGQHNIVLVRLVARDDTFDF